MSMATPRFLGPLPLTAQFPTWALNTLFQNTSNRLWYVAQSVEINTGATAGSHATAILQDSNGNQWSQFEVAGTGAPASTTYYSMLSGFVFPNLSFEIVTTVTGTATVVFGTVAGYLVEMG